MSCILASLSEASCLLRSYAAGVADVGIECFPLLFASFGAESGCVVRGSSFARYSKAYLLRFCTPSPITSMANFVTQTLGGQSGVPEFKQVGMGVELCSKGHQVCSLVLQAVDQLTDTVKVTMGQKNGKHRSSFVEASANATNDSAGNGTTFATVLTKAVFSESLKYVVAGINAMDSRRGINLAGVALVALSRSCYSQLKRTRIASASYPYQRSQHSKGDEKVHLWTERKPRASEFNRKTKRKALWVDGWSTPAWAKARLKMITQARWQSLASHGTKDWSQDTAQVNCCRYMHSTGTSREAISGWSQDAAQGDCSRYIVTAGITSEAIAALKDRLQRGIIRDSDTYLKVLQICLKQRDLLAARQIHGCIIESGMDRNPYVAGALLNVYIKCGGLLDARRVFDELENKNVISWNMMIAGYAKSDHAESALGLFNLMCQQGVRPDEVTYLSVLKACATPSALKHVKEIHVCVRRAGFESDVRVGTALVQMYAKCGCITEARRVFEKLTDRNVVTWNMMLGGYAANGSLYDARLVFDRMGKRNVMTWNIMIGAYAERGFGVEAYRLFLQMRREGLEPDAITYVNILNASASGGPLEWVKEVHGHASRAGYGSNLRVANSLVHMYAKSGSIDDARVVFDRMVKRDVFTWTTMIGGLAQHGCGHEALELFRKMNADLVKPNGTTFVAVLSACCHGGLLDDGRRLFSAMTQDYGIEPTVVHYNCMVDLLGRAGHLEEAKLFISDMPIQPDAITWKSLLGACRTYCNVDLGELAAKEVFKLEPNVSAGYVLLSNIYAAAGMWEKVSLVKTMMQNRGVQKEPGRSWIEVDNKIHEFVASDKSHPEATELYAYINKLTEKLKAEGYIPDTQLVLQNISEEDKELVLCSHSEKLAIAYGLMRIPRGEPIVVRKNLRVCSDCHRATKLISKMTGREIIARDATRFHRFKDGVCSCGDYW